jgi:mannosyltransferase
MKPTSKVAENRNLLGSRGLSWIPVAGVVLLGFALRIAYLTHESVGYDEAFSLTTSRLPLGQMMHELVSDFVHPPLHYFVLRGWFELFGFGVTQARLLSVLFSSAALVMLFLLTEYVINRRVALYASFLLAVSQISIWFAQEPRPYAQLQFLALLTCYLFVRGLKEQRTSYWWGFVGSAVLMLYTHYYGVFVIAGLSLFAYLFRARYRLHWKWILGGGTLAVAAFVPWVALVLPVALDSQKTLSGTHSYWAVHWSSFFSAVNFFNNGKTEGLQDSEPVWTFLVGGLLFAAPLVLALFQRLTKLPRAESWAPQEKEGLALASLTSMLPLLAVLGLGALHFQYNVRYVSFCAPPYYMLIAWGLSELRSNSLRSGILLGILLYSGNALRATYFLPSKEDFKDAFHYVDINRRNEDCGVFLPHFNVPVQWTITQGNRPSFRVLPKDNYPASLSACDRVWAVSWSLAENSAWWRLAEIAIRPLEESHSKVEERRYFGVHAALYRRKVN